MAGSRIGKVLGVMQEDDPHVNPPAHPEGPTDPDRPLVGPWGIAGIWGTIMTAIGTGNLPGPAATFAVCVASVVTAIYVLRSR